MRGLLIVQGSERLGPQAGLPEAGPATRIGIGADAPVGERFLSISDIGEATDGQIAARMPGLARAMQRSGAPFSAYGCSEISDERAAGWLGAAWFYAVAFNVPGTDTAAFEDWYVTDHVPKLMAVPGWLRVWRCRVVSFTGRPWTHFAFHGLASSDVLSSPERKLASTGPKRDALAERSWFTEGGRWLYQLVE